MRGFSDEQCSPLRFPCHSSLLGHCGYGEVIHPHGAVRTPQTHTESIGRINGNKFFKIKDCTCGYWVLDVPNYSITISEIQSLKVDDNNFEADVEVTVKTTIPISKYDSIDKENICCSRDVEITNDLTCSIKGELSFNDGSYTLNTPEIKFFETEITVNESDLLNIFE